VIPTDDATSTRRPEPHGTTARVLLVNMPFAGYRQPSLALGLLKAALAPLPVTVTVLDATLLFAGLIGAEAYDTIATWLPQDLLGDRIFAAALPQPPRLGGDDYEQRILAGAAPEHDIPFFGKPPLTVTLRAQLQATEERVGELLDVCLREIVAATPLVVGFTSMFHQHTASLALAARVKVALPSTCVVFGGASCHAEMGAQLLRSFPFVDAVACGEGEQPFRELVERRLAGASIYGIPGMSMQGMAAGHEADAADESHPGEPAPGDEGTRLEPYVAEAPAPADMDELPVPDYADYFARLAAGPLAGTFVPRVPFETSRGCWWGEKSRCSFCGQASGGMAFRHKGGTRALTELEELTGRHPGCPIFITDEILAGSYFKDFLPRLKSRLPDLRVVYFQVRPDLNKDQLRALADAGVRRLEVGIESLSTPVLRLMRKGTTALKCVQFLKWARELGIEVIWNVLWGFPGEDPREYLKLAHMVPLLAHLQPPNSVGSFRLDRFSPAFEDPDGHGLAGVRPYPSYSHVYDLPETALARLAYFFAFDYARPQDVTAYTMPLAAVIATWKEKAAESRLWYADEGERFVLADQRPGFDPEELTVLYGDHLTLYRACDAVQPAARLAKALGKEARRPCTTRDVHAMLAPLVQQGLMLREGSSYLSLALPLSR
jgi:ribosomal peptide maturation radical SAM protein 1